jgi:preprotein translocase subunit SecA
VALKEGCTLPPATRTVEQITVQGLFERYWRLGGASGTLRESRFELFAFYRLGVTRVQPRLPSRRVDRGVRLLPDETARTQAVIQRARDCAARGQPLLVGTLSVAACDALAQALRDAGFQPAVLHAREDDAEADLVTRAGAPGALTVATHMAGRGTDIAVHPAAQAAGGLQVLACALNPSRRVLRQLLGRTARQGAPGGVETLLAVNCDTLQGVLPGAVNRLLVTIAAKSMTRQGAGAAWLARSLQRVTQELLTWRDFRRRWLLVGQTRRSRELLARARGAV